MEENRGGTIDWETEKSWGEMVLLNVMGGGEGEICMCVCMYVCMYVLKRFYLFSERGKGGRKRGGENINVQEKYRLVASWRPPTQDLAHNPGMCRDQE